MIDIYQTQIYMIDIQIKNSPFFCVPAHKNHINS